MATLTDCETTAAACAVIEWTFKKGVGLRPLFDAGHRIATSDSPSDEVAELLQDRAVRVRLTEWATLAASRWPAAWTIATGFCRAWMMKQSQLLLSFDPADMAAYSLEASRPPDPGCTVEQTDLLAVGRVVRSMNDANSDISTGTVAALR